LYAALQELNQGEYNILTVEDPVQYRLEGVAQIPVQIGCGFAQTLRHTLRHDPDVILVGEIRDAETAKLAVESALTGHLVLSTLHTESAARTITRLVEIGIPPYLVNTALAGVLAQRLVRRNCEHCKVVEEMTDAVRKSLGVDDTEVFWRGNGCKECSGTGYRGRAVVYELLEMSPALRELVASGASEERLQNHAVDEGMVRLSSQALSLLHSGVVSLSEVFRARLE
jgi:type IV pilus assembly protein PilB